MKTFLLELVVFGLLMLTLLLGGSLAMLMQGGGQ